jgi:hypothetical protein
MSRGGSRALVHRRCTTCTSLKNGGGATKPKISRDCNLVSAKLTVNRVVHRCTRAPIHHVHHPEETSGALTGKITIESVERTPPEWRATIAMRHARHPEKTNGVVV